MARRLVLGSKLSILLLLWTGLCASARAAETNALDMGIFPYFSTRALLDIYQPLRDYLSQQLGEPVNLFTALSFKVYTEQTRKGLYDLVVTPPHFARLAQRETGYLPLMVYTQELRGIIVVPRNSGVWNMEQLRGKRIATPNRLALVTMMGQQLFKDHRLNLDEVHLVEMPSHNTAVLAVQSGEVDAALTERVALMQMPEALRDSVRVIAQTAPVPHVMILAHPRLGRLRIEAIKRALLSFSESRSGEAFFKESGFEGMRPAAEADLKSVDPYQKELKRLLENTP